MSNIPPPNENSSPVLRHCTRCGEDKPVEAFGWCNRARGWRTSWCKPCCSAFSRAYYAANAERCRDQVRQHRIVQADVVRAQQRAHYAANREKIREQARGYRQKQSEATAAQREAEKARQQALRDAAKAAKPRATCEGCGQSYIPHPGNRGRFCSMACQRRRIEKTCARCGCTFEVKAHQDTTARYCSKQCMENHGDLTCPICQCVFQVPAALLTVRRTCSRECYAQWLSQTQSGENHPNWRGGHATHYGSSWSAARKAARARDGVCQRCGISPEEWGGGLDVHHIVPFKAFGLARHAEANQLDNLVGLCASCHQRLEWELREAAKPTS